MQLAIPVKGTPAWKQFTRKGMSINMQYLEYLGPGIQDYVTGCNYIIHTL